MVEGISPAAILQNRQSGIWCSAQNYRARDRLQVLADAHDPPARGFSKPDDLLNLTEAKFNNELPSTFKPVGRLAKEPLDHIKSLWSAEECDVRLVADNVLLHRCGIAFRHVGRIRDDEIYRAGESFEDVAVVEGDALRDTVSSSVAPRHVKCRLRDVHRGDADGREGMGNRHRNASASRPDVDDVATAMCGCEGQRLFDDELGFRP